ncbi:hypothetical protein H0H87_007547 [Tephrocybe sp. NHM501043]|nr:hypothetical protein H0H87_007547 [Tephrocybe sp. NHM501043]
MANIVWDDGRVSTLGGGQWSAVLVDRFFGGGAIWPAFATGDNGDTGQYGTLGLTFHGTRIAFHGNTPSAVSSQNFQVSIDGSSSSQTSYGDDSPPTALQWYQSPQLSDAEHTITMSHLAGTSVDYLVITAGPNTPLSGERLIVDDGDDDITYSGNWGRKEGRYTSRDAPHAGLPHGAVRTFIRYKISIQAEVDIEGNDVAVYSVFDFSHIGWVTVKYTVDGGFQTVTHAVTASTSQYKNGVLQQENTLLWKSDGSLALGDHQLTIEIVDSDGQTNYVLDYILYTPSFRTLASKPNLTPTTAQATVAPATSSASSAASTNSASTTSGTSTYVSSGSGTGSVGWITVSSGTVQTISPAVSTLGGASSSSGSNAAQDTSAAKSTPVGAIAGGVVGGVVVLATLLLLFLCRKRLSRRGSVPETAPEAPRNVDPFSLAPFTDTVANTAETKSRLISSTPTPALSVASNSVRAGSSSDPRSEYDSDRSMSEHKSDPGQSGFPVILSPLRHERHEYVQPQEAGSDTTSVTGPIISVGGVFRSRMQRLQELVTELNREIAIRGEESVRVAELKGRIAELTREIEVADGDRERDMRQSMSTTVPPPYEPRRS